MESAEATPFDRLARVREASWSYLLGVSFFIVCVGVVVKLVLPESLRRLAHQALLVAPLLPLAAKAVANLPVIFAGVRKGAREPVEMAEVWCGVTAPFAAHWRYQLATLHGFVGWLRRRRLFTLPDGASFGFLERSSYSTFIAICVFSALVDLPLNGFILSVIVRDPHSRHVLHLVLAPLALYTLVWVLSDRWLMRGSSHVLTEDALDLKLGGRVACRVPLLAIERCEAVQEVHQAWCARHKVRRREALAVTPFDRPNVLLVLKPGRGVDALLFGARRTNLSHIFIYVDSPVQLITALRRRAQVD